MASVKVIINTFSLLNREEMYAYQTSASPCFWRLKLTSCGVVMTGAVHVRVLTCVHPHLALRQARQACGAQHGPMGHKSVPASAAWVWKVCQTAGLEAVPTTCTPTHPNSLQTTQQSYSETQNGQDCASMLGTAKSLTGQQQQSQNMNILL